MKQASGRWLYVITFTTIIASAGLAPAADTPAMAAEAATTESGKEEKSVPVVERVEQTAKTVAAATKQGVDKAMDATERGLDKAGKAIEHTADKAGQAVERATDKAKGAVSRQNKKKVEPKKDDSATAAKPD